LIAIILGFVGKCSATITVGFRVEVAQGQAEEEMIVPLSDPTTTPPYAT